MDAEDDDQRLLHSLGVTSANIEDIEKKILSQAQTDLKHDVESGTAVNGYERSNATPEADVQAKLHQKLRSVQLEIDAVASTIKRAKHAAGKQDSSDRGDAQDKKKQHADHTAQDDPHGGALQQALATERLKSLKKAKAQIQKEILHSDPHPSSSDNQKDKMLAMLVEEEPRRKKKLLMPSPGPKKMSTPRLKTMTYNDDDDFDTVLDGASAGFMETEREELIRKGLLTPFHKLKGFEKRVEQPGPSCRRNDPSEPAEEAMEASRIAKVVQSLQQIAQSRPTTKLLDAESLPRLDAPTAPFQRLGRPLKRPVSPSSEEHERKRRRNKIKRPLPGKKWRKATTRKELLLDDEDVGDTGASNSDDEDQAIEGCDAPVILEGGLKIPSTVYEQLFDYQKVGVQWLWELHCQRAGGIIGDEMGLGKTVQVLSFLGSLHNSGLYKPSIVVCPVTLLQQWRREASKWYPKFKVEILHDSANGSNKRSKTYDSDSEASWDSDQEEVTRAKPADKWDDLISHVVNSGSGLLLTTYEQLRILGEKLLDIEWGYAVLDEGHRIRNPNAEITLVCKQLQTVHRIIMTGAPIQNKLSELWSLFDFVFPGKLGVLPVFETEFSVPITVGGYANATPLQVSTAYRCAVVLRDLIMPYLLRRMKADVNAQLPNKTEHVLFCSLTPEQRATYRAFLASSEVEQIFDGNRNSLYGIDVLRKICNHPDLLEREHAAHNPDYGNPERSGKMKVVEQVLKVWKDQGHRVLLFAQTQQMLDILENFLTACDYQYRRMDGLTPAKQRMALIDEFNNTDEIFIFILTTKVGGLGTNLTGADRVIIYDPDWNPSTDMQARERAWRIGQTRDVTVYRLITRGTIEEKVYHRQIYKHFLTNKVLKNPQQRRFFKARDMKDLFTLQDDDGNGLTETSNIFSQLSEDVNIGVPNEDQQDQAHVASALPAISEAEPSSRGKGKVDQNSDQADEESNILKSLFDAQGIHSAINHDAIMNANDDQKLRLEAEASQVAQRAAEALRQSRMLRSRDSFAVPTWTGRSGAAGAPSSIRRKFGSTINSQLVSSSQSLETSSSRGQSLQVGALNGKALSSAELLARLRGAREVAASDALEHQLNQGAASNHVSSPSGNGHSSNSSNRSMIVQPEVLIRQLCTFIQQNGGSASSTSITGHFKSRIQSKDMLLFKNLLKEIATLQRDANGAMWVLKPDYE
ncbi:DNA excision repair protein CSB [Phragmites australis]|uniref:DNA excision repair protein CSB n=1 Tax=Phragmites australis TaxID=29695 RepID=UPI002D77CC92|nr:DNA excision repair protein CSB [Phragmites australis]XP_062191044.1 DNA excision repair protein CSB [Phragmites australis]